MTWTLPGERAEGRHISPRRSVKYPQPQPIPTPPGKQTTDPSRPDYHDPWGPYRLTARNPAPSLLPGPSESSDLLKKSPQRKLGA